MVSCRQPRCADTRSIKLRLNYYHGVNSHSQLRMDEINYLGISYSLDF